MTISTYIDSTYGSVKSQLGWDATDISTISAKALQLYGVSLEADATDETKLEAMVDFCVWRQALADISLDYSFSADGGTYNRQQAVEQVRKNMLAAENKALPYLNDYSILIHESDDNADWWEDE